MVKTYTRAQVKEGELKKITFAERRLCQRLPTEVVQVAAGTTAGSKATYIYIVNDNLISGGK